MEKTKTMWQKKIHNQEKENTLIQQGASLLLARLLSQRDVNIETYNDFLKSEYKNLSHPHALNNVKEAVQIFSTHALNNSRIGTVGDFDADGIISSVMIYELCKVFNLKCDSFIPSRFDHGYGLNEASLKTIKEKFKTPPDLVFVLDCGTSSFDEIEDLKKWGVKDVIVIDHHIQALDENKLSKNASALINWHNTSLHEEMCTCGEVFQFIRGIRWITKKVNPVEFLAYAAIGTIADSSPIIGDNRIIVKHGLTDCSINFIKSSGIKALMNECKIGSNMSQTDVSFKLAPRINAVGRIQSSDIVFKLLTEYDITVSDKLAKEVCDCNNKRKELQAWIEKDALAEAYKLNFSHGILLVNENWSIGVVGIVASRIAEEFNKPTIIIGKHNGVWKGSGRSEGVTNIKEIMDKINYVFEKYGGHTYACGVTLKDEYVKTAGEIFNNCVKENSKENVDKIQLYDASLKANVINIETANVLRNYLYPYCNKYNNEPIFRLRNAKVHNVKVKEGKGWQLLTFKASVDNFTIPYLFSMFSSEIGGEIEGAKADVYFTFPQKWNSEDCYSPFQLKIEDIEILS